MRDIPHILQAAVESIMPDLAQQKEYPGEPGIIS